MGRKTSKRAAPKKAFKAKLEKTFACPFCNHESAIECKLDRQRQIGTITCRICSAGYQTVINYLSEPVDVYGEWVDAIDAQEQKKKASRKEDERPLPGQSTSHGSDSDASESDAEYNQRNNGKESEEEDNGDFTEDDLVDYRQMPDRKRAKASEKSSKQATTKPKRKTISSSSDEEDDESEGLFGSESESEADFTDSEAEDAGVQSDEPESD